MLDSEAITHDIRVKVKSSFSEKHSNPDKNHWFFIYTITISNEGQHTVQLTRRHWTITDGNGQAHIVDGEGVVGEQPIIEPGQSFQYTSACPLPTKVGSMYGHYTLVGPDGNVFEAKIAPFTLSQLENIH